MARSFASSSDNLRNLTEPTPGQGGTISIWIKPNWNSGDSVNHVFWDQGQTTGYHLPGYQKYSDNNIYLGFYSSDFGDFRILVADTAIFVNGTWSNHIYTWDHSLNAQYYYVDGTQKGTSTFALTTFGDETGLTVGNYNAATGSANANCSLAHYARWSRKLTLTEILAISNGSKTPQDIPSGLVAYYHLGSSSPETDTQSSNTLTVTGTTIVSDPYFIINDSIALSEFINVTINPIYVSIFDSITLSDFCSIYPPLLINIFDSMTLTDSADFFSPILVLENIFNVYLLFEDFSFVHTFTVLNDSFLSDFIFTNTFNVRQSLDGYAMNHLFNVQNNSLRDAFYTDIQKPYGVRN